MGNTRKRRVAAGLCPECGEEAAPYYLCPSCRFRRLLDRVLSKGERAGVFRRAGRGMWMIGDRNADFDYREVTDPADKRLRPRLRGVPVDIERELMDIFRREGRPLTEAELVGLWGQLRVRPGRVSAAQDMAYIQQAQDKRRRRAEKRLRAAGIVQAGATS